MYDIAVQDLEIQPSEFWAMSPQEFWRLFDHKVKTQEELKGDRKGVKKACDLSEEEKQAALKMLKEYRQKHGQK